MKENLQVKDVARKGKGKNGACDAYASQRLEIWPDFQAAINE